jgi:hypothetical protein
MSITVQELADEFGVSIEVVENVTGLKSWSGKAMVSEEAADKARAELARAGYHAKVETPEPVGTEAPRATGLTLETYAPHPLVEAAIECASHQITNAGREGVRVAIGIAGSVMTVASAVALADLVAQGVAPFAEAPGVYAEANGESAGVLAEWVSERISSLLMADLMASALRGRGRDSTIIAFLREH